MKATGESVTPTQMMEAIKAIVAGPNADFIKDVSNSVINITSEWTQGKEVCTNVCVCGGGGGRTN